MAQLFLLTLALFAGTCYAAVTSRIVGGVETTINRYPSMVQVEFQGAFSGTWSQNCAGNILTTTWVLSAAQCFSGNLYQPRFRRIRAGTTYRNTGGLVVYVQRAVNHPSFGNDGFDGDISAVQLSGALVYNPVIQQATIISPGQFIPESMPVISAGWGKTSQGGDMSPVLRHVTMFTIFHPMCRLRYSTLPIPANVTENMICAGIFNQGGADACQGDAGGPLYFSNIVVGITSWGHSCGDAVFPGVFTAVSPYTNWIISVLNSF